MIFEEIHYGIYKCKDSGDRYLLTEIHNNLTTDEQIVLFKKIYEEVDCKNNVNYFIPIGGGALVRNWNDFKELFEYDTEINEKRAKGL